MSVMLMLCDKHWWPWGMFHHLRKTGPRSWRHGIDYLKKENTCLISIWSCLVILLNHIQIWNNLQYRILNSRHLVVLLLTIFGGRHFAKSKSDITEILINFQNWFRILVNMKTSSDILFSSGLCACSLAEKIFRHGIYSDENNFQVGVASKGTYIRISYIFLLHLFSNL